MKKKSPVNFQIGTLAQSVMGGLMGRSQGLGGGGRKARKIARSTNKRVKAIQKTLEEMNVGAQAGAPAPEGLGEAQAEMLSAEGDGALTEETGMDMGAVPETPSAIGEMEEETFATASDDSGLNMIRRIARRK